MDAAKFLADIARMDAEVRLLLSRAHHARALAQKLTPKK